MPGSKWSNTTLDTTPQFIQGPKRFVAKLTFLPVTETIPPPKPPRPKKGQPKPPPPPVPAEPKTVVLLPIPLINQFYDVVNGALRSRSRIWARNKVDGMIADWRERGKKAGEAFNTQHWQLTNDTECPLLDWAAITFVCYWPNRIRRDAHNLWHKPILDGLTDAGMWVDDSRIIDTRIVLGGVDKENPRIELYIYSVQLTLEQQSLLIETKAKPKAKDKVVELPVVKKSTRKKKAA